MMTEHARQLEPGERRAHGRGLRKTCGRVEQARWKPPADRQDPVALVVAANRGRVPQLLPIKCQRMVESAFGFFRGAAPVMARDLASQPRCGLTVQICGDAHVLNLGSFSAPDGRLIFDINDFDETVRGPFEWDVKRLATSLVLAGREASESDKRCKEAVRVFVRAYREAMFGFSRMTVLDLARYRVHRHPHFAPLQSVLRKAERATPRHNLERLTVAAGGARRFKSQPPLLTRVDKRTASRVLGALKSYRQTLTPDRQHFFDQYHALDVAFKVVGMGSVGLRDYVVLLLGNGRLDALFLQVKEEPPSCYARYLPDPRPVEHEGRRVVEGQRAMQAQSDFLLGWTTIEGRDYQVRQLSDHKASIEVEELAGEGLLQYALVCGEVLAKGHARSGDPCALAGYLGSSTKFDTAIAAFALAYADQVASDHRAFVAAVSSGKIKAAGKPHPGRRRVPQR
ncbi:MAG TPA: DUF2252 domain-containing protein [Terriglobales bacterium]|nr:DUF2252 domain-containing protein [Terriglobales bacterium]